MNLENANYSLLIESLDKNYVKEDIDGITCYFHTDKKTNKKTARVVALKTSDNCVGLCVNTYGPARLSVTEEKTPFIAFNAFNPLFVVFGNNDNRLELLKGINTLVDILKITGDISLISFGKTNLNVAQLHYERDYKVDNNPLYNNQFHCLNIKAIGDITREQNNVKIRFEKMGLKYNCSFNSIFVTGSYRDFKQATYENIMTNNIFDKPKQLKKTI